VSGAAPSLYAVVLAAGASTRFGSPKQLVRFEGQLLLHRALAAAAEAAAAVTIVLGAHAAEIAAILPPSRASVLVNRDWQEGIASSLRAAVRALPGACDAVLIMLADQPLVVASSLMQLSNTWRSRPRQIIASRYSDVIGVPAIFPRWCFNDLCGLRGDQGARVLISHYADHVQAIPLPEAAVDIDQPEDLLNLSTSKA
jgi:molybdenum cofactor cytidylyltransferase